MENPILQKCSALGIDSVRGAYFFGGACPLTAWDSFDRQAVENEIRLMKADGFNTVLVVFPLSLAFHAETHPTYDMHFWANLEYLLARLEAHEMCLSGRLFYVWDQYPTQSNRLQRTLDIYTDARSKQACLKFAAALDARLQQYSRFLFLFLCWEDLLPHLINNIPRLDDSERQRIGMLLGYARSIPKRESLEFGDYLDFLDQMFNAFLEDIRGVCPRLSAEIRVDGTPYGGPIEGRRIHSHLAQAEPLSDVVCSYYAPYMHAPPRVTDLEHEFAFRAFEHVQQTVAERTPGKIFVDQMLLVIEEKQHSHLPKIKEDSLPTFVELLAGWFREKGLGYATWCFRDYFLDAIGNSNFGLGLDGWQTHGGVQLGPGGLAVSQGAWISCAPLRKVVQAHVLIDVSSEEGCSLRLTCNDSDAFDISVDAGSRVRKVFVGHQAADILRVNVTSGSCTIRRASVGWDVASNGGYGLDLSEGAARVGIAAGLFRKLNLALLERSLTSVSAVG